jgi:hypothetical protein
MKKLTSILLLSLLLFSCLKDHENDSPLTGVTISDVTFTFDETQKVIDVQSTFTNISAKIIDTKTNETASWLTVKLAKGKLILNTEENTTICDRQAKVTLYMDGSREHVSNPDLEVSFLVTQKMNDQFEGLNISEVVMDYLAGDSTIVLGKTIQKAKIDVQSVDGVSDVRWGTARLNSSTELNVKVTEHKARGVRQALIRLLPNSNKTPIDSLTATTVFLVTQNQNAVFEGVDSTDVMLSSDACTHTLILHSEPTGIKSLMVDSATNASPKWLSVKFEEKAVKFTATSNASMSDRKATVTLYYPNGTVIDSNTVKMTFNVRQKKKDQSVLEKKSLTLSYEAQAVEMSVTSNVGINIQGKAIDEQRISISGYHIEGTTHKIILNVRENKTESVFKDTLHLVGSGNSGVKADLLITQKTNPTITLFEGEEKEWSFRKDGGVFQLLVSTLTPNYKIEKKASWISIGAKTRQSQDKYYHSVTVREYAGEGPLRTDTIYVKNDEVTQKFVVSQDKYLYLSEANIKMEVGEEHQLRFTNKTTNAVTWKSTDAKVASVSDKGLVTALKRGTTQVKVSIGKYNGIDDYADVCTIKVYDASDSVLITRDYGSYEKTNGYVTAHCPITISNTYKEAITLESVKIVDNNGNSVTWPTSPTINRNVIKKGGSLTVTFPQITNYYKPKVSILFTTANGMEYTKEVDY